MPERRRRRTESCGNTAFRETEISIDGQPAGVAPIYPWIFTGGIDPYLWIPIPGVQTLNFAPYRVDLTPVCRRPQQRSTPHRVASVSITRTATSRPWVRCWSTSITRSPPSPAAYSPTRSLATPYPNVSENLNTDASGNVTGNVAVTSDRSFVIAGYVMTSHGMVNTAISQQEPTFRNVQNFDITDSVLRPGHHSNPLQQLLLTPSRPTASPAKRRRNITSR